MRALLHKILIANFVVLLVAIPGVAVRADTVEHYGIAFELPSNLLSARRLSMDTDVPESRRHDLLNQLALTEQQFQRIVDFLIVPPDNAELGGMTIGLEPVEEDDVSDEEYMNQVWEAMLRMASHLDDPATQVREFIDPSESYGFSRMDVSNAYGSPGAQASFLTKKIGEQYLMVIIVTDGDSHSDHYKDVLKSLRPIPEYSN